MSGTFERSCRTHGLAFFCASFLARPPFQSTATSHIESTTRRCVARPTLAASSRPALKENDFPQRQRASVLPLGTTSLLLRICTSSEQKLNIWLREWARVFLFSSQSTLPVPLSLDMDDASTHVLFHASVREVRGVLTLSAEADVGKERPSKELPSCVLRVTSSSLFINPGGDASATLPGERRIVRTMFTDLTREFTSVRVLYKPSYIRLKSGTKALPRELEGDGGPRHVTMFVAEVQDAEFRDVRTFVQSWGSKMQFGGASEQGVFASALTPSLSTEIVENGLKITVLLGRGRKRNCQVLISVRRRRRGRQLFKPHFAERGQLKDDENSSVGKQVLEFKDKVLVLASATLPEESGARAILQRYGQVRYDAAPVCKLSDLLS